jgi:ligand-binding sensor domain-containing protein
VKGGVVVTPDGGAPDAGATNDGGTTDVDAGTLDGGPTAFLLHEGPPLDPPDEILSGKGLGSGVVDASHDAAGNLWAVDSGRLYLRRAGYSAFESFNRGDGLSGQQILSVGGGVGGTAWVGYKGMGDGDETDPRGWWETGGADKVVLNGADIKTTHYALTSPPGMYSQYPQGRYKLRRTLRVYATRTGPHAGDAWFACNHGTALVSARGHVLEHHHPTKCIWDPSINDCLLKIGDVPAISFTSDGRLWFGGTYGVGSLVYDDGSGKGTFWGEEPVRNTSLFKDPISPNGYGSEDIVGVAEASDGSLWAASAHSGLAHRLSDGTVEVFQEAQGLPTNDLEDLAIDDSNGLWVATTESGLFRIDLATGEWRRATGLPSRLTKRLVFERTDVGSFVTLTVRGAVVVYTSP